MADPAPTPLDRGTRLRPSPHVRCRPLAGDAIVLDMEHGLYFRLNATGALVWSCLESGATLGEAHAAVIERFDARADQAWTDLLAVARDLLAHGLVQPSGESPRA